MYRENASNVPIIKFYSTNPSLIFVQEILRKIFAVPDPGLTTYDDNKFKESKSENHSVMSDSLRPHGLNSPWNSSGQNIGMNSLSLLQGIFPAQGSNCGLLHCRQIIYQLSYQGSQFKESPLYSALALQEHQYNEKASITLVTTWQDVINAKDSVF